MAEEKAIKTKRVTFLESGTFYSGQWIESTYNLLKVNGKELLVLTTGNAQGTMTVIDVTAKKATRA
jgi:hypothetical protein